MKVMLVDGNSLTYRAFFALPTDLTTASGQVTNAVYGFTSMLINLVRDHRPDQVVVAFDRPEPTFRHEAVPTYKANRSAAPDILRQQMGLVRQVVEALQLPIVDMAGFEADDIIATFATEARDAGDEVVIVTGDRDSYQLVEDPLVKVLYNKRGVSDYALYDEAGILERTGVPPTSYVEYAALRGDPSDNLPGVPGVGEKTAAKLIITYGGLDGIFEHVDEQTPKLRANLAEAEEQRAQERRAHAARPRRRHGCAPRRPGHRCRSMATSCATCSTSSSSTRCSSAWPRRSASTWPGARPRWPSSRPSRPSSTPPPRPSPPCASWRPATRCWRWPRRGTATRAPALLAGLALVRDASAGDVVFVPGDLLGDADVAAALAALVGPGGRPLAVHGAKTLMRALLDRGIDVRHPAPRPLVGGVPARSGREPLPARRPPRPVRPPAPARRGSDPGGPARLRRRRGAVRARERPPRPRRGVPRRPDAGRPRRQRAPRAARRHRGAAGQRAGPHGARRRRCRHRAAPRPQRPDGGRVRIAHDADLAGRRRGVQRQLHAAAPHDPVRQAGPHPAEEDQDGLLHRRRVAREAGRRASDHRPPAALPRGREAALDLRRGPARVGPARRADPCHLQPDRRPDRSAELGRTQPAQHPGAQRGGSRSSARRSSPPPAPSSWSPTTTRSSCAASPTWPRTRA